jgi:hypothetical protein
MQAAEAIPAADSNVVYLPPLNNFECIFMNKKYYMT